MEKTVLDKVLQEHLKWVNNNGGKKANLYEANLSWADLRGANLYGANLRGAENIPSHVFAMTSILQDEGDIIGWKKCTDGVIIKLLIKNGVKRSNATGRKCRAEKAKVLDVIGVDKGISSYDGKTEYIKGKTVKCNNWDNDRWNECGGGIHFFITRYEAEDYQL